MDLVIKAMALARQYHQGQVRSTRTGPAVPYVMHLMQVNEFLNSVGASHAYGSEIFILGFLHDIIEDTAYPEEHLLRDFGEEIAEDVLLLTLPRNARVEPYKTNHQLLVMQDSHTANRVRAVKIADKTANVHDLVAYPPRWGTQSILAYAEAARKVVDEAVLFSGDCPVMKQLQHQFSIHHRRAVDYWSAQGGA